MGGLFSWVGIDPDEEVLRTLLRAFFPNSELMISVVILSVVLISTVLSILGTLSIAGKLGLLVVVVGIKLYPKPNDFIVFTK